MHLSVNGDWNDTFKYLENLKRIRFENLLNDIGQRGVETLRANTPIETGRASSNWGYEVKHNSNGLTIEWHNYDIEGGYNVVLLVEYGHGLRQGGYVAPHPFINASMQPIFQSFADDILEEVNKA